MQPDSVGPSPARALPRSVSTLLGHAHVEMALACLGSLLRYSTDPLRLLVHDDGTLTDADRERLLEGLAEPEVLSRAEADERAGWLLARYPAARAFRQDHPLGLKLLDVSLLAAGEDLAYCDSDVLFLRPFSQLFHWPTAGAGAVFMSDTQNAYSVRSWQVLLDRELCLAARVNSGLIHFKLAAFDLDLVEWFLARPEYRRTWAWIEQTCWALLANRAGCWLWDPARITFPPRDAGEPLDAVALHFVSPLRGLLPSYARSAPDRSSDPAVAVNANPARACGWLPLARAELGRRARRGFLSRPSQPGR